MPSGGERKAKPSLPKNYEKSNFTHATTLLLPGAVKTAAQDIAWHSSMWRDKDDSGVSVFRAGDAGALTNAVKCYLEYVLEQDRHVFQLEKRGFLDGK